MWIVIFQHSRRNWYIELFKFQFVCCMSYYIILLFIEYCLLFCLWLNRWVMDQLWPIACSELDGAELYTVLPDITRCCTYVYIIVAVWRCDTHTSHFGDWMCHSLCTRINLSRVKLHFKTGVMLWMKYADHMIMCPRVIRHARKIWQASVEH